MILHKGKLVDIAGSGYGYGDGSGYGYGDGSGYGYGDGEGSGYGYGDGDKIKENDWIEFL